MNAAREMVREWYPDATPEQVERFASAIYLAMSKPIVIPLNDCKIY